MNTTALEIEGVYKTILGPAQPRAELAARLARACRGTVATAQPAQKIISTLLGLAATVSQLQCARICAVSCCTSWQCRLRCVDCVLIPASQGRYSIERLTAGVAAVTHCIFLASIEASIAVPQATASVCSAAAPCHAACAGNLPPAPQHASRCALMGARLGRLVDGCHQQHPQGTARLLLARVCAATNICPQALLCYDVRCAEH